MAMFERFTERAVRVIMAAQEEAKRLGSAFVGPEHLLLGMLREGEPVVLKTLEQYRIDPATLKGRIEEEIAGQPTAEKIGPEIPFNAEVKKVIELAWDEARGLGHSYVGVEHLLLGILREGTGSAGEILKEMGITIASAKNRIVTILGEVSTVQKRMPRPSRTPILDGFSRDLSALARERKLDPVIGRVKEIERVTQILSRRKKNNPVLIGEAGVGRGSHGCGQYFKAGPGPRRTAVHRGHHHR
jgi:ATP-dependent Clp protease ATP-binding subunit ClpC